MPEDTAAFIMNFEAVTDPRGDLTAIEHGSTIPFITKRVYYIYNVPAGAVRGAHAHRSLQQLIIALSGSFTVKLDFGDHQKEFFLNNPRKGLFVNRMIWRELVDFSQGAVCLVLASSLYDPHDYIRDHELFLSELKTIDRGKTAGFEIA